MLLHIQQLTYRVAGTLLLDQASFCLMPKQHVGLIGANGSGKSTLFRLITEELSPDSGTIERAHTARIGMLAQEVEHLGTPILDVVLAADKEREALLQQLTTEEDPMVLGLLYGRLEEIDAYSAPARAATILSGLGFSDTQHQQLLGDFSGGWQMRVALAALLFSAPDLLLLDEPSNHLDFESQQWLEHYLQRYPHSFIMISHDRTMLNQTVDTIVHLDRQRLTSYTGNYDRFERLKAEAAKHHAKLYEKQQAERTKMQSFIDRFRAKASKARQAQSRLKMLEKMECIEALTSERSIHFEFPSPESLASPLISLDQVSAGYATPCLQQLNLRIDMDDRIALLGANGNGKSTLLKLLAGSLKPMTGSMSRLPKMRIGYFSQHQTEVMDAALTPVQWLQTTLPRATESQIRTILGRFEFDKRKADTVIGSLSGGEKSRLLFCAISLAKPHVLLLDEPTNHLDMDAKDALVRALNLYEGAVILVTHDMHLVSHVADRLWIVRHRTCQPYAGDIHAYATEVIQERRGKSTKEPKKNAPIEKKKTPPDTTKLEQLLAELLQQKSVLEQKLAETASSLSPEAWADSEQTLQKLDQKIAETEQAWMQALDS